MKNKRLVTTILVGLALVAYGVCAMGSGEDVKDTYTGSPQYYWDAYQYGKEHPGFYDWQ